MKIRKAGRTGLAKDMWQIVYLGNCPMSHVCVEIPMWWVCKKLHLPGDCFLTTGFRTVSIGNKDQRTNQKDCVWVLICWERFKIVFSPCKAVTMGRMLLLCWIFIFQLLLVLLAFALRKYCTYINNFVSIYIILFLDFENKIQKNKIFDLQNWHWASYHFLFVGPMYIYVGLFCYFLGGCFV